MDIQIKIKIISQVKKTMKDLLLATERRYLVKINFI